MRNFSNVSWQKMTSNDTYEVIRETVDDLTRNAKTCVNSYRFLTKFQNILILVRVVAV